MTTDLLALAAKAHGGLHRWVGAGLAILRHGINYGAIWAMKTKSRLIADVLIESKNSRPAGADHAVPEPGLDRHSERSLQLNLGG